MAGRAGTLSAVEKRRRLAEAARAYAVAARVLGVSAGEAEAAVRRELRA